MKPISCVLVSGYSPLCMVSLGKIFAFPIFNHLGANTTSPELCDCSVLTDVELARPDHDCNVFRFLSGFIYTNELDVDYWFQLIHKHGTVAELNKKAHRVMFIAS